MVESGGQHSVTQVYAQKQLPVVLAIAKERPEALGLLFGEAQQWYSEMEVIYRQSASGHSVGRWQYSLL